MGTLEDRVRSLREQAIAEGRPPVSETHQGVSKSRIEEALRSLKVESDDTVDVVFALLDQRESWFSVLSASAYRFCDGATTAHLACHVGILQRGGTKLDREGRDYWLKPLRELGVVQPVYLDPRSRRFVDGHAVPKSPNSAYSLNPSFEEVLQASEQGFREALHAWNSEDARRRRAVVAARAAAAARNAVDTTHADLIRDAIAHYVPSFLPGYEVVYTDDDDGNRVTEEEHEKLDELGLSLGLADAWPDVLLWNELDRALWVIEAVTSDGEVDETKVQSLQDVASRAGVAAIGFTTVYRTWRAVAARQSKVSNLAPGTYLWIQEDGSRAFLIRTIPDAE